MYRGEYERRDVSPEVGLKKIEGMRFVPKPYLDDESLLARLKAEEKIAENAQVVSYDSPTSD